VSSGECVLFSSFFVKAIFQLFFLKVLQLELPDILSCNFMVNNCYLVAISSANTICIFDLREPPERHKVCLLLLVPVAPSLRTHHQVIYMSAPSHAMWPSPTSLGPSSPRAPRELSARSMELRKKERVTCVAVVDPFSFLGRGSCALCRWLSFAYQEWR